MTKSRRRKYQPHKWTVAGPEYGTLCISREANQSVLIGDQIEILFTRIHGSKATFSVRAPKLVTIVRSDLERHNTEVRDEE